LLKLKFIKKSDNNNMNMYGVNNNSSSSSSSSSSSYLMEEKDHEIVRQTNLKKKQYQLQYIILKNNLNLFIIK
jgi:hypothetical protein